MDCSRHRSAVWYRAENRLCEALRIEAHFGKVAVRLTLDVGLARIGEYALKILVSPLSKVMSMVAIHTPERIVSLLDPDDTFPEIGPAYSGHHLRLCLHDIHIPAEGQVVPTAKHIDELLAFLSLWSRKAPILIHCRAGISRSTAAAFITACLHNPQADESEIARALRRASPLARPNGTLIKLADAAMSRNGKMSKAIEATGRNLPWIEIDEGVPFEMSATFGRIS